MKNFSLKRFVQNLLKDESGQGTTEYILILVGAVAIGFAFKDQIVNIIKTKTGDLGAKIQSFQP